MLIGIECNLQERQAQSVTLEKVSPVLIFLLRHKSQVYNRRFISYFIPIVLFSSLQFYIFSLILRGLNGWGGLNSKPTHYKDRLEKQEMNFFMILISCFKIYFKKTIPAAVSQITLKFFIFLFDLNKNKNFKMYALIIVNSFVNK